MNWEAVRNEWESSEITFKELAEKHGLKDATIRSRKNREKWQRNDATQRSGSTSSVATKKKNGKQQRQQKRSGNPSPSQSFPKRNSFSRKHGLFSKYLHEEQVEIMDAMADMDFTDQLWLQIEIKFSAIIRMQKIMWVGDAEDHLKEESGYHSSIEGGGTTYKVAFAYERYESYIKAQTRAMAEYRNLVKQFLEMTDAFDERRLKLETMQVGIDKTRAEADRISKEEGEDAEEIVIVDKWGKCDA
ncbi:phage terminase small subunit [Planomicrobium sp. YIM 101495]|uniref:phage terminase small subunit n=1 Tax=Planomicrobium sp. YIM 101495 TaxID=2665160 RepID=UPI0012B9F737|nr:hypothetical protein [Planomicrobium sp. YIM 101495]